MKDILSMWNTPDRVKAYIILGVSCKPGVFPYKVVGLPKDTVIQKEFPYFNTEFMESERVIILERWRL